MSETITFESAVTNEVVEERYFPRLDGEVTPLVAANADVIVRCPWMGGAEVTLAAAMVNYPNTMTEETADQIIADIYELLANRVVEAEEQPEEAAEQQSEEEPEPEAEPEPEEPAETENRPQEEKAKLAEAAETKSDDMSEPAEKNHKVEQVTNQHRENSDASQPTQPPVKIAEMPAQMPAAPKPEPSKPIAKAPAEQIAQPVAKPEPSENEVAVAEAQPEQEVISATAEPAAAEQAPVIVTPEPKARSEPAAGAAPTETRAEPVEPLGDFTAESSSTVETEPISAPEVLALPVLEVEELETGQEAFYTAEEEAEPVDLLEETIEYEMPESILEPEIGFVSLDDELEETIQLSHFEEEPEPEMAAGLQPQIDTLPIYETAEDIPAEIEADESAGFTEDSPIIMPEADNAAAEQTPELALAAEELQETIANLIESVAEAEPKVVEMVNEILEKIAEVPAKLEAESETVITEAEAEEELEELFVELLTVLELNYTPEEIKSLTRLAITWREADKAQDIAVRFEEMTQDYGTHEAIKQLLTGFGAPKQPKSIYSIGRSALKPLARFSLSSTATG